MDPYDLPEEFSHLQAQDMSKLGFMQDLIRGVKRIVGANRADRLAEVIYAMKSRGIEPKRLQFVRGKENAKPYLILLEGTKGAKEGLEILPDHINQRGTHF